MIKIENVCKHINDKDFLKNHARWRNESLLWTREDKKTDHSAQYLFFSNLKADKEFFVILNDLSICGVAGLTDIRPVHKTAEFSILIGSEYQRKGYATQALKEVLKYGFTQLKLNLIFGETFAYPAKHGINPGARAYEKLGFTCEGRLRSRYFKDGMYVDSLIYSITKDEFDRSLSQPKYS